MRFKVIVNFDQPGLTQQQINGIQDKPDRE